MRDQTAIRLAETIMASTQGRRFLERQLPLVPENRSDHWLVRGTPYTDERAGLRYCFSYFLIEKATARVIGLGTFGRANLTAEKARYWHGIMSDDDFERVFGLRTRFEPGGEELAQALFFHTAVYGGLINRPDHALIYAETFAADDRSADLTRTSLAARLQGDRWSIEDMRRRVTVMTIARRDCLMHFNS